MTSAIPVQRSTNWANKPTGQYVRSNNFLTVEKKYIFGLCTWWRGKNLHNKFVNLLRLENNNDNQPYS